MSHIIYGQNKLILHFTLCNQLIQSGSKNPYLKVNELILIGHHFQYSCAFYEQIYNHFKFILPENTKKSQIRINYKGNQLPSDLPIGLYIEQQSYLKVSINNFQIGTPYEIIVNSWKCAFSAINSNRGCYFIRKSLNDLQRKQRIQRYLKGQAHALQYQKYQGYQGTHIIVRYFIDGQIIQRKSQTDQNINKNIQQMIYNELPELNNKTFIVKSHGVKLDLNMNIKQFLDQWSYNDGYNYITIQNISLKN